MNEYGVPVWQPPPPPPLRERADHTDHTADAEDASAPAPAPPPCAAVDETYLSQIDAAAFDWDAVRYRNDPTVACVWIGGNASSVLPLGVVQPLDALISDLRVTEIWCALSQYVTAAAAAEANWVSILNMIQNRPGLTVLGLLDFPRMGRTGLCDRLLRAATQNPSLQSLHLCSCIFSDRSLLSLLTAGTTATMKLRTLVLSRCAICPASEDDSDASAMSLSGSTMASAVVHQPPGDRDLAVVGRFEASPYSLMESSIATAVQNNTMLTALTIGISRDSRAYRYLTLVVHGLARAVHSKVETLELQLSEEHPPPAAVLVAIQTLLLSTAATATPPRLRSVTLRDFVFQRDALAPLALGIQNCARASALSFKDCRFETASTLLLEEAFTAPNHRGSLTSLAVDSRGLFWQDYRQYARHFDVFANMLGPASRLLRLELSMYDARVQDVTTILRAVAASPQLEFLVLEEISLIGLWAVEQDGLPGLLTLRSFHFTMHQAEVQESDHWYRENFVAAVRENSSLTDAGGQFCFRPHVAMFDAAEVGQMKRYADRNKALAGLLDSSRCRLPVRLWPRLAVVTVRQCEHGPGWMVRMLLSAMDLEQPPAKPPPP